MDKTPPAYLLPDTSDCMPSTPYKVSDLEWRTLMVGAVVMESSGDSDASEGGGVGTRSKPASLSWLSTKAWEQLLAYEATLGAPFAGLPDAVERAAEEWKVNILDPFNECM